MSANVFGPPNGLLKFSVHVLLLESLEDRIIIESSLDGVRAAHQFFWRRGKRSLLEIGRPVALDHLRCATCWRVDGSE